MTSSGSFPKATWTCIVIQGKIHFSRLMTSRLDDDTKLVGSLISCGGMSHRGRNHANPHIQSFAVATDAIGLNVLLSNSSAFECFSDFKDVVINSELGMSRAIIDAGYNLGSFLVCPHSATDLSDCQSCLSLPYDGIASKTWLRKV